MAFVAKYKNYNKTKPVRIPEELTEMILMIVEDLDNHKSEMEKDSSLMEPNKILETTRKYIKTKPKA